MARLARIVIPGVAHHIRQRGNRGQSTFFGDEDRLLYLRLVGEGCARAGVDCIAWCLLDNDVQLIAVPATDDGLRAALGESHRRYTRHVNTREGWSGYLFQGRFASYPMEDTHLIEALRYVEQMPVVNGLVDRAEDWRWSSAASHRAGRRLGVDTLTDIAALARHVRDWRTVLYGAANGGHPAAFNGDAAAIQSRLSTGRPLATSAWIAEQEVRTDRRMAKRKPGPKAVVRKAMGQ